jgi:transposase-like protein
MICKKCGTTMAKSGSSLSGTKRCQRYKCSNCGYAYTNPKEPVLRVQDTRLNKEIKQ